MKAIALVSKRFNDKSTSKHLEELNMFCPCSHSRTLNKARSFSVSTVPQQVRGASIASFEFGSKGPAWINWEVPESEKKVEPIKIQPPSHVYIYHSSKTDPYPCAMFGFPDASGSTSRGLRCPGPAARWAVAPTCHGGEVTSGGQRTPVRHGPKEMGVS